MMAEEKETKENANKWLVVVGLIMTGLLIGGGLVFAGYKLTQQKVPEAAPTLPVERPEVEEATPSPAPAAPVETLPGNCDDECVAQGFVSGYCGSAAVYPGEEPCESGETNIGWTKDCQIPEGLIGVQKGCCCVPDGESASGGPTADWEIYTNTDYGYQFKHPAGWIFTARMVATDPSKPLYVIRQEVQSNNIDDYLVSVRAWDNPDGLSLADWIQFMKDSNAFATPTEDMDTTANTEVGGEQALQFWSDPLSGGQEPGECFQACPVLSVYFVHGDKAYAVELNYMREFDEDSFILFSQILSTFEFL